MALRKQSKDKPGLGSPVQSPPAADYQQYVDEGLVFQDPPYAENIFQSPTNFEDDPYEGDDSITAPPGHAGTVDPYVSSTPLVDDGPLSEFSVLQAEIAGPEEATAEEGEVVDGVVDALYSDPSLEIIDLKVAVQDGVCTLAGGVFSPESRTKAEELASRVVGVEQVDNALEVISDENRA